MPTRGRTARRRPPATLAGLALFVLSLAGCGAATSASPPTRVSTSPGAGLTVTDAWVKSGTAGMTSVFGTLFNGGDHAVTVVGASSPASRSVALHEVVTVDGVSRMRAKRDGFTVAAHGSHRLEPSGDHLMLMGLSAPVLAGDAVRVTLSLADGSRVAFTAIAKDYAGANETYAPTGMAGMPGMNGNG